MGGGGPLSLTGLCSNLTIRVGTGCDRKTAGRIRRALDALAGPTTP
jgi:hypothetical protein